MGICCATNNDKMEDDYILLDEDIEVKTTLYSQIRFAANPRQGELTLSKLIGRPWVALVWLSPVLLIKLWKQSGLYFFQNLLWSALKVWQGGGGWNRPIILTTLYSVELSWVWFRVNEILIWADWCQLIWASRSIVLKWYQSKFLMGRINCTHTACNHSNW